MIEDGGLEKTTGCMDSGLAFGLASDCGNISVQSVSFKTIFSSVMVRWVVVMTYKGARATEEYARSTYHTSLMHTVRKGKEGTLYCRYVPDGH